VWQYSRALRTQALGSNRQHLLKRVVRQKQEAFYTGKTSRETRMNTLKNMRWYRWQNKTLRAGLCFARSWRDQLGLNFPDKRSVTTLNEAGCVELGADGGEGGVLLLLHVGISAFNRKDKWTAKTISNGTLNKIRLLLTGHTVGNLYKWIGNIVLHYHIKF
jgi:hypothetical protein